MKEGNEASLVKQGREKGSRAGKEKAKWERIETEKKRKAQGLGQG